MKSKRIYVIALAFLMLLIAPLGFAQETVFTGLQSNLKKAEKNYIRGSYKEALKYFLKAARQKRTPKDIYLKIAQTYRHLNDHKNAVHWFNRSLEAFGDIPPSMDYLLAESLCSLGMYKKAIASYENCRKANPSDKRVLDKIWRLKNLHYLYEDSIHYTVIPVTFNSPDKDYAPTVIGNKLVFLSNRELHGGIKVLDGISQKSFFKRYVVGIEADSSVNRAHFDDPIPFASAFGARHHQGPITFSDDGLFAVFTQSSPDKDPQGNYPMLLYYANQVSGAWSKPVPFGFNDPSATIGNPSLSPDGNTLYFSADFDHGFGGLDLYKSEKTEMGWSAPENLGGKINTVGNEDYPFIHPNGSLYFGSDGQGGLGGLDIFEVKRQGKRYGEVRNLGYPVNTQFDELGIYLNDACTEGYLASNRNLGALNDDIFRLELDLQSYPLTIQGILKYRNPHWEDSLKIDLLTQAKLQLTDIHNNEVVYNTVSGNKGEFILEIPYSSQFKIKVIHPQLGEHAVSLEIPKNKKLHKDHEIVVVKEQFQNVTLPVSGNYQKKKSNGHESK